VYKQHCTIRSHPEFMNEIFKRSYAAFSRHLLQWAAGITTWAGWAINLFFSVVQVAIAASELLKYYLQVYLYFSRSHRDVQGLRF
jgi:hypothetical protein